jgi:hypothetical protein
MPRILIASAALLAVTALYVWGIGGGTGAKVPPEEARRQVYVAFDNRPQVPVGGSLAALVRSEQVGWDMLMNTAIGADDAAVRRDAIRAALQALDADSEMQASVLATLRQMSDVELAEFARDNCHHRAEDLVGNVAAETRDPEVRERAQAVLDELRKRPFKGPIPTEGASG